METNNIPEELFDLLAEKNYAALSSKEKEMALAYMSIRDYSDLHQTIKNLKKADAEIIITPPPFRTPQKPPSLLYTLLHYKISAYKVAASVLILAGLLFAFRNSSLSTEHAMNVKKTGMPVTEDNYPNDLIFEL